MRYLLLVAILPGSALGSSLSIGPLGINAVGLRGPNNELLDGTDVKVGQVETLRPADPDEDTGIFPNSSIDPEQVTLQQMDPPANNFGETGPTDFLIRSHPTEVAGILISTDATAKGVATDAMLYADAYVVEAANEVQALKSIQHVINAGGYNEGRAVNNSWNKEFPDGDGFSQLTLGVDWMATRYDSLIVVAVNDSFRPDHDSPADNFNGITVGASQRIGGAGAYRQAWGDSDVDVTSESVHYEIDLLAPGVGIEVTGLNNVANTREGGSYATPHVTGTAALLQQYANLELARPGTTWDSTAARRHEVMKAVLLNSADKISGVQGSTRTVEDIFGNTWEDTPAFADERVPLDPFLGAGHLNAGRALTQFKAGPIDGPEIDNIGWHYGETGGVGTIHRFTLGESVSAGEYVSITLTWDRAVSKSGPLENTYGSGDFFGDGGMSDLDLYLLPAGWESETEAVELSISAGENVEHIFAQVPAGDYEIVVSQFSGNDQKYGLAWWIGDAPTPIPGDFNGDGGVDGADLTQWKGDFGGPGSDADGDGDSDGADFLVWQKNLGMTSATPTAAAVPEPAAAMLCTLAASLFLISRRRR